MKSEAFVGFILKKKRYSLRHFYHTFERSLTKLCLKQGAENLHPTSYVVVEWLFVLNDEHVENRGTKTQEETPTNLLSLANNLIIVINYMIIFILMFKVKIMLCKCKAISVINVHDINYLFIYFVVVVCCIKTSTIPRIQKGIKKLSL